MTEATARGLTMRSPGTEEVEKISEMINRFEMHADGEKDMTPEVLASRWEFAGFDHREDARIMVDSDGNILGYTAVWNDTAPHIQNMIVHRIDPVYIGTEVDKELLAWAEEKAGENIAKAPDDAEVIIGYMMNSSETDRIERMKKRGYGEKRYFWRMGIDLDRELNEPDFPADIRIVTHADRQDLMEIVLCERECFRDHWGYTETPLDEELAEWKHWLSWEPHYDPAYWFLALSGDEIVGMCLCLNGMTIGEEIGYVCNVCVKKEFRKKGIAAALLRHSFTELKKAGRSSVYLHVDASSLTGATRLYESVGMEVNQKRTKVEKIIRPGKSYRTESL